ncbi:TIM-barrel domain-containing protein [Saccharicrinis sp. FJH62]|uniref:TIM-barrel domain-containing protein n=1 Tax=Saccharicrinis sp. FJH62 TaxID=3344657 RepID=UPI0035D45E52
MEKRFYIRLSLLLALVAVSFSCKESMEREVKVSLQDEYPAFLIPNGTHSIAIVPENELTGSIGFIKNNDTTWVKGNPEVDASIKNQIEYSWPLDDETEVTFRIKRDSANFDLNLSTTTPEPPTEWLLNIKSVPDEYFTGVFERVVDGNQSASWTDGIQTALNLRGTKMDVKLKPTVSAYAPFYVSSENYGLFVKGTWPGVFDFCKSNPELVKVAFEGPELNFKLYVNGNPMQVVQQHARDAGPSIIPPQWAFGPWRWRDQHFNKKSYYDGTTKKAPYNTDMVEDVLMMQAFDIPVTAQWIDRPWGPGPRGFDDYKFDTKEFPDPEGMIKWINSKDQELMLWIGPFVMGDMADYAEEHHYGLVSKPWFNTPSVLMDFTNDEAVEWWGKNGPGKLAKMGVKGFKLDRADGEKLADSLHLRTSIETTYRENYNDYPRQYVKATYDAVKPVLGDDFVLFPRAEYTGSSRYGAMWAGDTNGKPEGLRSAIIGVQRCAVMGYPNWGSDIGGYWGQFSRETALRWLGFGCFSPIMEVGPTNNLAFWSNPTNPSYDSELIATWRLYSKIHYKLAPYIHELSAKASEEGTPIVRPLFLVYPDQKEAWNDWQTYMFGPDILVSAIWQNKDVEHKLYLPAGETWVDAWNTGKEYKGGSYITVQAPLHKIPFFIRKGSTIELGDLNALYEESLTIASKKPDLKALEAAEGWK